MSSGILLIIIDMQYDFCSSRGALYVPGAENDVSRLAGFITANESLIDHIVFTQDNHNVVDISHPVFWEDDEGKNPEPFTQISYKHILRGTWRPRFYKVKAAMYIKKLEQQGEFPHTIWPEHCIIGSRGAALVDGILEPAKKWSAKGRFFEVVVKGTNPLTEHFGALQANVPIEENSETQLNTALVNKLRESSKIYIAGEAKSHCVATTIKQLMDIDGIAKKLHILEDCMSNVTGFENIALPIYEKAASEGSKFVKSTDKVTL